MSQDEMLEQPQASSKPLSDFNDLHVSEGLGVVREQIESGISAQSSAFSVSPDPLVLAGHFSGQMSEFGHDNGFENQMNACEDSRLDDFSLDFAPPMNGHQETGSQEHQGARGGHTDDEKLQNALDRYAVISCSNDAFDLKNNHKFKISSLKHTLSTTFKYWYSHDNRKTIEKDEVEKL